MKAIHSHHAGLDSFAAINVVPLMPPPEPIAMKLDRLSISRNSIEGMEAHRKEIVDAACAGIRSLLDSLDNAIGEMKSSVDALEGEIREAVLFGGESVKGSFLHAVFNRGRVSYDVKGLDALAMLVPEVLHFRKEGAPSVAIREVK